MLGKTARLSLLSVPIILISLCSAWAADHEDGPITFDRPADISDFHAFVNPNDGNDNVVLSMAVNGFSVPGFANSFSTDTLLQIKIDNTGDFVEDLVIQFVFEDVADGQNVTVIGPARPAKTGAENKILRDSFIEGVVGGGVFWGNGIKAFAGPTDDATWVDLVFVQSLLLGVPLGREPGIDTVQGLNATTVAVELPPAMLGGSLSMPNGDRLINVWATVSRQRTTKRHTKSSEKSTGPWIQIDRVGIPAINPLLVPPARRDEFNHTVPSGDVEAFRDQIIASILKLNGGNMEHAEAAADFLLPDVFLLNLEAPTMFPLGRLPESDFVDGALGLLSNGGVTSDGVPGNDVDFLSDFPFFPPPHTPMEAIPPRD